MYNSFDAAESPIDGTFIIEAGAGTGKTYSIAILVLRLILTREIPIEKILVVTFTKAATEELKDRIDRFLREALDICHGGNGDSVIAGIVNKCRENVNCEGLLKKAILSLDEAPVFTIHGFCMRVLEDNAFEADSSFNADMLQNQDDLLDEITGDFFRKEICALPESILKYRINALSFNGLRNFLKEYLKNDLELSCPENAVAEKTVAKTEALRKAVENARNCWERDRREIVRLLEKTEFKHPPDLLKDIHSFEEKLDSFFKRDILQETIEFKKFLKDNAIPKYLPQSELNKKVKAGGSAEHEFFTAIEELVRCAEERRSAVEEMTAYYRGRLYGYAWTRLKAEKNARNIRYYDDLLLQLNAALKGAGRNNLIKVMDAKYKAVLIDEFQDTDAVQYEIFHMLFKRPGGRLFFIGDPKQSVYGFRGADIFSYMSVKKQMPLTNIFTMGTNYRSSDLMVKAFNLLFDIPKPFKYEEIPYMPVEAHNGETKRFIPKKGETDSPLVIWKREGKKSGNKRFEGAQDDAHAAVASEIISLLEGASLCMGGTARRVEASDIGVLVPSRKYGDKLMEVFQSRNIPAVMSGTKSVFASEEARELLLVLRAAAEPLEASYINGALLTGLMGWDTQRAAKADDGDIAEASERFREYRRLWEREGFIQMMMKLLSDYSIRQRLMSRSGGARGLTNILHLSELLHNEASSDSRGIQGLVGRLGERIKEAEEESFRGSEEQELRLERDDKAVTVMTIHGSKGLEFPIVFAPYMWQKSDKKRIKEEAFIYHDKSSSNKRFLVLDGKGESDPRYKAACDENLAERLRLFYVAVTRARSRCYLMHSVAIKKEKTEAACAINNAEDYFLCDMDSRLGNSEVIAIVPLPAGDEKLLPSEGERKKLEAKVFTGNIQRDWKISSFTYMTSGKHGLGSAADEAFQSKEEGLSSDSLNECSIFTFKRGADAGNALHEILEKISFDSDDHTDTIKDVLRRYRLAGAKDEYVPIVERTIKDTLCAPLPAEPSFCLADINGDNRVSELRFWFPVPRNLSKNNTQRLELWNGESKSEISIDAFNGFVNGAVDLLFKYNGKYYIADWKSNYLGKNAADYEYDSMHNAMLNNSYNLQYMLYSLASDRFLRRTDPAYSFDTGFGGVFYIFLRGVGTGEGRGIYSVSAKDIKRNMKAMKEIFSESGM